MRARQAAGRGGRAGTRVREFAVATHWRAVPGRRAARVTALPDMFVSVSYFANHPMRRLCIALLCKLKLRCLFSRLASLNKLRRTERVNPSYVTIPDVPGASGTIRIRKLFALEPLRGTCADARRSRHTAHPGRGRGGITDHAFQRWRSPGRAVARAVRAGGGRWAACSRRRARRRRRAPIGLAADGQRP